jgi:hypothetical protein
MLCIVQAARHLFLHGRPYSRSYLVPRGVRHTEIKDGPSRKTRRQNQKTEGVSKAVYLLLFLVISWATRTLFCTLSGNISILPSTFNLTPYSSSISLTPQKCQ